MKKILTIVFICILACFLNKSFGYENGTYQIIKVIDGDTLFLDFNHDGKYQQEEKVRINGIDTFEVKPSVFLKWQMKEFILTQSEALGMGYFGKEFAKKNLLNKYVKAEYTGNTKLCDMGRQLMSISYDNGKNYEQEVLKVGLATVYKKSNLAPELSQYENLEKIKSNIKHTHGLNLVLLNKKNNIYHKVNCEFGLMASNVELINKSLSPKYKPASCCYPELVKNKKLKNPNVLKQAEEKYLLNKMQTDKISLFFVNPVGKKQSKNACINDVCRSLVTLIDNSKQTIDVAAYGFQGQDEIINALRRAKARGVIIRGVCDDNTYKFYFDTRKIESEFGFEEDIFVSIAQRKFDTPFTREVSGLMHNKFLIFDNAVIWAGSTNLTDSCMTLNANNGIVIYSKDLANVYTKEFNQMYEQKKFHTLKDASINNINIKVSDDNLVSVYFSPKDEALHNGVIPLIQQSHKTIRIMMFYFTNKKVVAELINARNRGVDIEIIVDYEPTAEKYSAIDIVRGAGIPIKVENWNGKMHTKSAVFDDEYCVIGSTNWTSTAEYVNDENMLVIKSTKIANQITQEFNRLWKAIPAKYLHEKAPANMFKEQ